LRSFVRERVHKEGSKYERGAASKLAAHLRKPPSWVSNYVDDRPARNADLDTALAICDFFHVRVTDFRLTSEPVPTTPPPPALTKHQSRMLRLMQRMNEEGERLAVRSVVGFAAAFPKRRSRESPQRSIEKPSGTARTTRERRQADAATGIARKVAP
jgi:hypothetical protein